MGILQNAINQAIGAMAIRSKLDPELVKKAQVKGLKRDIEGLKTYSEQLETVGAEERDVEIHAQRVAEADELLSGKYGELSKLDPTAQNIDKMIEHKRYAQNIGAGFISAGDTIAANQRAADIQEKKSEQAKNYLNFVGFMTNPTETESEFKRLTGGNK